MKVLYFDCFSGISGDMALGTLLDLGADANKLTEGLKSLNVDGYQLIIEKKLKKGIMGTNVTVLLEDDGPVQHDAHSEEDGHLHHHEHLHDQHAHHETKTHTHEKQHGKYRDYKEIIQLIETSGLNDHVKQLSKKIFDVVAEAEGKIHGTPVMEVHFHEVGAVDSIVDIVGTAICIDSLGADQIHFSKLPLCHGFVKCHHGVFPLPAPATLEILKGVPVYFNEAGFEQVTPTGAAIAKALGDSFGELNSSEMGIEKIGYGLGKKETPTPNVLRAILFNVEKKTPNSIFQIEANIDDMPPEQLGYVMDKLLSEGALDVFFTSIQMKKSRPGIMLTVLSDQGAKEKLIALILRETSTFGVRYVKMEREILERETIVVETVYGKIRCKIGRLEGQVVKLSPEYEDCKNAAAATGKPLSEIYHQAISRAGTF